jgi:hypothetical protein
VSKPTRLSPDGPAGPDLGHREQAATTAPSRPATPAPPRRLQPPETSRRLRCATSQHRRRGWVATVHRRLPTSPAWEEHTPGREEAPAAGTARALPGGSRRRRRRGEEEGEGSMRIQIGLPLGRPRGDDQSKMNPLLQSLFMTYSKHEAQA